MFSGNFAPRSWALCEGQLLSISQNNALFSLLGTTYGGDGRTTFGLPDLRGRLPMHTGSGPGLTPRPQGQKAGSEREVLNSTQLPSHTHTAATTLTLTPAAATVASSEPVAGMAFGNSANYGGASTFYSDTANSNLLPQNVSINTSLANSGASQQLNNLAPFACINFIIALFGTYPSRT